jgi:hypothetical protein
MNLAQNNMTPMPNNHLSSRLIKKSAGSRHDKLVAAARKWVAQSFFEPVLKQARENPFHKNRLSGGKGADTMASLQDEFLAGEMASGFSRNTNNFSAHTTGKSGNKLVDSIVNRIEAKSAYAKQSQFSPRNMEREGADRSKPNPSGTKSMTSGSIHV